MSEVSSLLNKEQLIKDITDFVGKDGTVAFEHGYKPNFNVSYIHENEVHFRFAIGRQHQRKCLLEDMTVDSLMLLIIELFRYLNYCQNEA